MDVKRMVKQDDVYDVYIKSIEVNSINLVEKDVIEIDDFDDFIDIAIKKFSGDNILNLKGTLYLIGVDVVYTFKKGDDKKWLNVNVEPDTELIILLEESQKEEKHI